MESDIFKALADPNRRKLLDLLYASDGKTLIELCEPFGMSRFGIMKHLKILEEAGLITTRRAGREKQHYLNAIPIRQIYERWVSKYTEPWSIGLTSLENELECETKMENSPRHVYRIAIKATPEQVWQAISDPVKTSKFWFNCSVRSDWKIGSPFELWRRDEKVMEGAILDINPPNKLAISCRFVSFPEAENDSPSRITWEIRSHAEFQGVTLVSVVHNDIEQADTTAKIIENGMPIVLSGLKTLLETGELLVGE